MCRVYCSQKLHLSAPWFPTGSSLKREFWTIRSVWWGCGGVKFCNFQDAQSHADNRNWCQADYFMSTKSTVLLFSNRSCLYRLYFSLQRWSRNLQWNWLYCTFAVGQWVSFTNNVIGDGSHLRQSIIWRGKKRSNNRIQEGRREGKWSLFLQSPFPLCWFLWLHRIVSTRFPPGVVQAHQSHVFSHSGTCC